MNSQRKKQSGLQKTYNPVNSCYIVKLKPCWCDIQKLSRCIDRIYI